MNVCLLWGLSVLVDKGKAPIKRHDHDDDHDDDDDSCMQKISILSL